MSVKILNVKMQTEKTWENVADQKDWNAIKNSNANWSQLIQTTSIGQTIFIEVEVVENNWHGIKRSLQSWRDVSNGFTNWLGLKNW